MSRRLGRRAALRGGAAVIALPTLEAMAATPAVRLVTFFLPNGFPLENRFIPREVGRGYTATPCLGPIARHLERCTVVSNVDGQGGPDSHAAGDCLNLARNSSGLPADSQALHSRRTVRCPARRPAG